jgi:hypothetical protein
MLFLSQTPVSWVTLFWLQARQAAVWEVKDRRKKKGMSRTAPRVGRRTRPVGTAVAQNDRTNMFLVFRGSMIVADLRN